MNFKRRGAETGSGFQEAVNRVNEAYEKLGRACITRKAIPGKYLVERGEARRGLALPSINFNSHGSQARLTSANLKNIVKENKSNSWRKFIPESKAEPDYGGVVGPDGRAIFYDAKSTRREILDFDNLHAHQIEFLARAARFGAIAGFLVEFSTHHEIYFLPIQVVQKWRENTTRKSFPYQFFVEHLINAPAGQGLIMFDYLAAIEEQENRYGVIYELFQMPAIPARRTRAAKSLT